LTAASFLAADLTYANLHGIEEDSANFDRAIRKKTRGTDAFRLEAEAWQAPAEGTPPPRNAAPLT